MTHPKRKNLGILPHVPDNWGGGNLLLVEQLGRYPNHTIGV